MKKQIMFLVLIFASSCAPAMPQPSPISPPATIAISIPSPSAAVEPTLMPQPSPMITHLVPDFDHIVIVIFENREFGLVIDNPQMPTFNRLARENVLLTQHYAIMHPSLPNYIALIGGDTFGIDTNCSQCFIDAPSLPDLIEGSGRTWKTYQEDMPSPCYVGDTAKYVQKHNPFIYFDPIRSDQDRCERSIVPMTQLDEDLHNLPDFVFITPNICNSSHDCPVSQADHWMDAIVSKLLIALDASKESYLLIITFEEGQGDHACCGLSAPAGGRVVTVLISPQAKKAYRDDTPYTHYSILRTISEAWGLPQLGQAKDDNNQLIVAPWE